MPSQLERTSAILGEYMLKGWTLTDLHCEICRSTPLMREPPAEARARGRLEERLQFCALCDGGPEASSSPAAAYRAPSAAEGMASRRFSSTTADSSMRSESEEWDEQGEDDTTPPANTASAPSFEFISPLDPQPPVSRSVSTTSTGPSLAAIAASADPASSSRSRRSISPASVSSQPPTAPPDRPLPSAPDAHDDRSAGDTVPHERNESGSSAIQAVIAASSSFASLLPPHRSSDGSLISPSASTAASGSAPRRASAIASPAPAPSSSNIHPFSSAYAASIPPPSPPRASVSHAVPSAMRSERVAQGIASYLERGYSLLADNCTQPTCVGIPLIGYPKRKDGSADGRKLCVSCGGAWVDASKMEGMRMMSGSPASSASASGRQERTTPQPTPASIASMGAGRIVDIPRDALGGAGQDVASRGSESPRSRMRRELYEAGSAINASVAAAEGTTPTLQLILEEEVQEKDIAARTSGANPLASTERYPAPSAAVQSAKVSSNILPTPRPVSYAAEPPLAHGIVDDALANASEALAYTLGRLSTTLSDCMSGDNEPSEGARASGTATQTGSGAGTPRATNVTGNHPFVDIKLHTEAMRDVLDVLERVGRMERAREMRRRTPGPPTLRPLGKAAGDAEE